MFINKVRGKGQSRQPNLLKATDVINVYTNCKSEMPSDK